MEVDVDSFPLLRPDQIATCPSDVLTASQAELAPLLDDLRAEPAHTSLLHYAQQQYELVAAELLRRDAARRVAAMLQMEDVLQFAPAVPIPQHMLEAADMFARMPVQQARDAPFTSSAPESVAATSLAQPRATHADAGRGRSEGMPPAWRRPAAAAVQEEDRATSAPALSKLDAALGVQLPASASTSALRAGATKSTASRSAEGVRSSTSFGGATSSGRIRDAAAGSAVVAHGRRAQSATDTDGGVRAAEPGSATMLAASDSSTTLGAQRALTAQRPPPVPPTTLPPVATATWGKEFVVSATDMVGDGRSRRKRRMWETDSSSQAQRKAAAVKEKALAAAATAAEEAKKQRRAQLVEEYQRQQAAKATAPTASAACSAPTSGGSAAAAASASIARRAHTKNAPSAGAGTRRGALHIEKELDSDGSTAGTAAVTHDAVGDAERGKELSSSTTSDVQHVDGVMVGRLVCPTSQADMHVEQGVRTEAAALPSALHASEPALHPSHLAEELSLHSPLEDTCTRIHGALIIDSSVAVAVPSIASSFSAMTKASGSGRGMPNGSPAVRADMCDAAYADARAVVTTNSVISASTLPDGSLLQHVSVDQAERTSRNSEEMLVTSAAFSTDLHPSSDQAVLQSEQAAAVDSLKCSKPFNLPQAIAVSARPAAHVVVPSEPAVAFQRAAGSVYETAVLSDRGQVHTLATTTSHAHGIPSATEAAATSVLLSTTSDDAAHEFSLTMSSAGGSGLQCAMRDTGRPPQDTMRMPVENRLIPGTCIDVTASVGDQRVGTEAVTVSEARERPSTAPAVGNVDNTAPDIATRALSTEHVQVRSMQSDGGGASSSSNNSGSPAHDVHRIAPSAWELEETASMRARLTVVNAVTLQHPPPTQPASFVSCESSALRALETATASAPLSVMVSGTALSTASAPSISVSPWRSECGDVAPPLSFRVGEQMQLPGEAPCSTSLPPDLGSPLPAAEILEIGAAVECNAPVQLSVQDAERARLLVGAREVPDSLRSAMPYASDMVFRARVLEQTLDAPAAGGTQVCVQDSQVPAAGDVPSTPSDRLTVVQPRATAARSTPIKLGASAPAPVASPYAAAFPEFRHIFTGCLSSSTAPAFAGGGLSGSIARAAQAGAAESAKSVEAAASAVLQCMSAFLGNAPVTTAMEARDDDDDSDKATGGVDDAADVSVPGSGIIKEEMGPKVGDWTVPPRDQRYIRIASSHKEVVAILRRAIAGNPVWQETPPAFHNLPAWNIMWSWGKPPIARNLLLAWQKVNHFKMAKELTRKDLLKKNLARYQCLGPKMAASFTLQPPTFVLPKEYLQFAEEFGRGVVAATPWVVPGQAVVKGAASGSGASGTEAGGTDAISKLVSAMGGASGSAVTPTANASSGTTASATNLWIMKPVGLSRGRGISLVSDMSHVRYAENTIIQKYISNPLLLDGYKFDLRLYVLVTSFAPLEAFIYKRGFARISSRPFTNDPSQINDLFIHLTNSSVQRHSDTAQSSISALPGADATTVGGTKCSLEYLWKRLRDRGVDTDQVWESIIDLVVRSLVCVDDVIPHQPNSFEVFGYDVLIDATLKPWLVEVNASPSLGVDSPMDLATKKELLADTLALVDPLPMDRSALVDVIQRRLKQGAGAGAGAASSHRTSGGPLSRTGGGGGGGGAGSAHVSVQGAGMPATAGAAAASAARERLQLDSDLSSILYGRVPRVFGTMPERCGNYQRICPGSTAFNRVMALKLLNFRSRRAGAPPSTTSSV